MKRFSLSAGALVTAVLGAALVAGAAFGITSSIPPYGDIGWLECIGASGCAQTANAIDGPGGLVISHDQDRIMVASAASNSVDILTRTAKKGTLTQQPGAEGCVSETGAGPCGDGRALVGPSDVTELDNFVYVVSPTSNSVAIIVKNPDAKNWRQSTASDGCVSEDGTDGNGGPCVDAYALTGARSVEINDNGSKLWVGGTNSIALFERNKTTGLLKETGCVSATGSEGPGCTAAYVPGTVTDMAASSDGKSLYAVVNGGGGDGAVLAFSVFRGVLTEIGCVNDDGSNGCTASAVTNDPVGLALDEKGQSLYVAANGSDSLVSFDRSRTKATRGLLTPGPCYSEGGAGGCTPVLGIADPQRVRVCENRGCVMVSAGDGVAAFQRSFKTGVLTQPFTPCFNLTGSGGCTQADGLGGAMGIDSIGGGIKQLYVAGSTSDAVSEFHLR